MLSLAHYECHNLSCLFLSDFWESSPALMSNYLDKNLTPLLSSLNLDTIFGCSEYSIVKLVFITMILICGCEIVRSKWIFSCTLEYLLLHATSLTHSLFLSLSNLFTFLSLFYLTAYMTPLLDSIMKLIILVLILSTYSLVLNSVVHSCP